MQAKMDRGSTEEVQSKKTLDLYAAVKKWLNEEKYVNDPGDRRGARLKFRFRTRSAGLRAEVGGWKNKEEAKQCVNSQLLYNQVSHNCRIIQYSAVYCMSYLQSFPFLFFLWLFVADIFHWFLLGTGRMPHPVGGAMGVTLCHCREKGNTRFGIISLNIHKTT